MPLKVKPSEERKAYTKEQLSAVFSRLPQWRVTSPPEDVEKFWIPLIALHSGLRLEEIAHLKTSC